jgi:hypothetical protein
MGEHLAALADVHASQLAGPFIQIAEQLAMNGLQVSEVKLTFKRRLRKFVRTCRNQGCLSLFERVRIRDAEAIL